MVCCVQLLRPESCQGRLVFLFCGIFSNIDVLVVEEQPKINMRIPFDSIGSVHLLAGRAVVFPKGDPLLTNLNVHAVELGLVVARDDHKGLTSGCKTETEKSLLLCGDVSEEKVGGNGHCIGGTGSIQGGCVHRKVNCWEEDLHLDSQSIVTSFHPLRLTEVVEDLSSGVADQVPGVRKT